MSAPAPGAVGSLPLGQGPAGEGLVRGRRLPASGLLGAEGRQVRPQRGQTPAHRTPWWGSPTGKPWHIPTHPMRASLGQRTWRVA